MTLTLAAPINSTSSITGPGNLGLNSSSALSQTVSNITLGGGIVEAGTGGVAFSGANCITLGNYSASGTIITMNASSGALAFNNSATPSGQSDSIALFINANTGNTYTISQNSNNLLSFNEAAGQTNVVEIGNSVKRDRSINGSGTGGVTFNGNLQSNTGTAGGPNAVPILSISGGGVVTLNGSQFGTPGQVNLNTGGILLLGNSYATAQDGLTMTADAPVEPLTAAQAFLGLAKKENPDLIFLGKQAIDDDANQTGQMLAALWERPQATYASKLEINGGKATMTREVDASWKPSRSTCRRS